MSCRYHGRPWDRSFGREEKLYRPSEHGKRR